MSLGQRLGRAGGLSWILGGAGGPDQ